MKHVKECFVNEISICDCSPDCTWNKQREAKCICQRLLLAGARGYKQGLKDGYEMAELGGLKDGPMPLYDPRSKENRP